MQGSSSREKGSKLRAERNKKRQIGKIFQAVVLRHVWNQCLGGSKQLLIPKDGLQSTNLIDKIGC